jgi:hypothetical protein
MLTDSVNVLHLSSCMGRPRLAPHLRRSKILPVRLSTAEFVELERVADRMDVSIGQVVREGIALYIKTKGKDGHRKRKEKKQR